MSDQKTIYVKGAKIKEVTFGNGGSSLNVSVKVDTFIEELKKFENNKGYVNLRIKKRKGPDEYGYTHYIELNTWTPDPSKKSPYLSQPKESLDVNNDYTPPEDDNPDLPF